MMNGKLGRWSLGLTLLVTGTGIAQAQESFVVAGPLSYYLDTSGYYTDHTFTATIQYDSTVSAATSTSAGFLEEALFDGAVIEIQYRIFDSLGQEIVSFAEQGLAPFSLSSYILARKGLAGLSADELHYTASSISDYHAGEANIQFTDSTGTLVSDLSSVPEPPSAGDFEAADVDFLLLEFALGDGTTLTGGLIAEGIITLVEEGETDPFEECAEQARNHGEYVSCVSHINNLLRAAGEITGNEKGQSQKQAASK